MQTTVESVIYTAIIETHNSLILGAPNDKDNILKTGGFVKHVAKRYYTQIYFTRAC